GTVIALALFELITRHLYVGHQVIDPRFGWVWRSVTVIHRLIEGFGVSHWRDDATRFHPPAIGLPRVLVVGDSYTEALQVDDDEVFTARMHSIDALNAGRAGHSPAEYVAFGAGYRELYRPAWTIVELGPADLSAD